MTAKKKKLNEIQNFIDTFLPIDNRRRVSKEDPAIWYSPLENSHIGQFSYTVLQCHEPDNVVTSQVEVGRNATFVGIYDGHGGIETAEYLNENLFPNLIGYARDNRNTISDDVIKKAIKATEFGFLRVVATEFDDDNLVATVGSSCLIGLICNKTLYVANLGGSRAVIASKDGNNKINARQLANEQTTTMEEVDEELLARHLNDPTIRVGIPGMWRVKGSGRPTKISASIGDAYLKFPFFAVGPEYSRFHPTVPISHRVIESEPSIEKHELQPNDRFVIFASEGLWDILSNEEAVNFVSCQNRKGVAKKLVQEALTKVAEQTDMTYNALKVLNFGSRQAYHDDITAVVLYLDQEKLLRRSWGGTEISVKSWDDTDGESQFKFLRDGILILPPDAPTEEDPNAEGATETFRTKKDDCSGSSGTKEAEGAKASGSKKFGTFWPFVNKKKVKGSGPSGAKKHEPVRPSGTKKREPVGQSLTEMDEFSWQYRTEREKLKFGAKKGKYAWASLTWGKLKRSKSNPTACYFVTDRKSKPFIHVRSYSY